MENLLSKGVEKKYIENKAFTGYIIAFIGLMVLVVIVYNATLPTVNTALYGASASTANLSAANLALSGLIGLLVIVALIMFVLRIAGGSTGG